MIKTDFWVVVRQTSKTDPSDVAHRLFLTYAGGYYYGDSWRLTSEIESIERVDSRLAVTVASGKVYGVQNDEPSYRTTGYSASVLASYANSPDWTFDVIPWSGVGRLIVEVSDD